MPRTDLVNTFLDPSTPKRVRLSAARGAAPLSSGEMVELLVHLSADADQEIAVAACATLADFPEDEFAAEARSEACSPEVLLWLASFSSSEKVLETVILNTNTPPSAIENLASKAQGQVLESILYNKIRIIENPAILENLKRNASVTPEASRQIIEIEAEFFKGKNTAYEIESAAEALEAAPVPSVQEEVLPDLTSLEGLPVDPAEREEAILEKLAKMTVPQKRQQAMFGNREIRAILVRDNNREVAKSVLRSPKLTESEVESFAAMRNVSDDVLREIGNSREWTRCYAVVHSLVKNPKTPPMIAQRMLGRLHTKDLALIGRDRGIPEAVRRNAQRMAAQRASSKSGG